MVNVDEKSIQIPIYIIRDNIVTANGSILYGLIALLAEESGLGYCNEPNRELSIILNTTDHAVSNAIKVLEKRRYIKIELIRNPETFEVEGRKIYPLGVTEATIIRGERVIRDYSWW